MLDGLPSGRHKFALARFVGGAGLDECLRRLMPGTAPGNRAAMSDAYEAVVGQLDATTRAVRNEREPAGETVKDFLSKLPGRIDQGLPPSQPRAPFIDAVAAAVKDHLAAPHDPFLRIFDHALAASVALYDECPAPAAVGRVRPELVIEESGPVGFAGAPAIDAWTKCRGNDVVVTLSMTAGSFGLAELRAIPYVFFHELICHGLGPRESLCETGPWPEVWMDLVAGARHRECVAGVYGVKPALPPDRWPARATLDAAEAVQLARHRGMPADLSSYVRAAAWPGANAAREAASIRDPAGGGFSIFCVAVTRSGVEAYARDEICERVGHALASFDLRTGAAFAAAVSETRDAAPADRVGVAERAFAALP